MSNTVVALKANFLSSLLFNLIYFFSFPFRLNLYFWRRGLVNIISLMNFKLIQLASFFTFFLAYCFNLKPWRHISKLVNKKKAKKLCYLRNEQRSQWPKRVKWKCDLIICTLSYSLLLYHLILIYTLVLVQFFSSLPSSLPLSLSLFLSLSLSPSFSLFLYLHI